MIPAIDKHIAQDQIGDMAGPTGKGDLETDR